jgi:hypothetical protein
MSRGPGWMQRYLFMTIRAYGKPITFCDIRSIILRAENAPPDAVLRSPVERSLRRALHSMVRDQMLAVIGRGRPGDPFRYFINPLVIAMVGDESEYRAYLDAIEHGGNEPMGYEKQDRVVG